MANNNTLTIYKYIYDSRKPKELIKESYECEEKPKSYKILTHGSWYYKILKSDIAQVKTGYFDVYEVWLAEDDAKKATRLIKDMLMQQKLEIEKEMEHICNMIRDIDILDSKCI